MAEVNIVVRTRGGAEYRAAQYDCSSTTTVTLWEPEEMMAAGWGPKIHPGAEGESWLMAIPYSRIEYVWIRD